MSDSYIPGAIIIAVSIFVSRPTMPDLPNSSSGLDKVVKSIEKIEHALAGDDNPYHLSYYGQDKFMKQYHFEKSEGKLSVLVQEFRKLNANLEKLLEKSDRK